MLRNLGKVLILFVFLISSYGLYMLATDYRDKDIRSELDSRLDNFNLAKQTAYEVEKLVLMDTQEGYEKQAQRFKGMLDQSVYQEYFPSDSYGGGDKDIELKRVDMRGSIEGEYTFTFKYDALIVEGKEETPLSLLVFIKGNKIIKIKSLG